MKVVVTIEVPDTADAEAVVNGYLETVLEQFTADTAMEFQIPQEQITYKIEATR